MDEFMGVLTAILVFLIFFIIFLIFIYWNMNRKAKMEAEKEESSGVPRNYNKSSKRIHCKINI